MIKNQQELVTKPITRVQILETLDTSAFSDQLKEDFKMHFLPVLKRMMPEGSNIEVLFLSDPPSLEIRRVIPSKIL